MVTVDVVEQARTSLLQELIGILVSIETAAADLAAVEMRVGSHPAIDEVWGQINDMRATVLARLRAEWPAREANRIH